MNSDREQAAFRVLTSTDTVGFLDFTSSAAEQTIVLDAGVYQPVVIGSSEVLIRTDGNSPVFPSTAGTTVGILAGPGPGNTFVGSATVKAVAKAVGVRVYFQRVKPQ